MLLAQISGKAASGKSTAARFLDPTKTFYIDCDSKGLSWKGWREQYSTEKDNYVQKSSPIDVMRAVRWVADNRPDVNCIVIDTINALMTSEEMAILESPSRDKWADLAVEVWNLYKMIREHKRQDIVVFVLAHIEPYEVNGITHWRTQINGKKLSKVNLNAYLNYNLYMKVDKGPSGANEYKLVTTNDGTTEARSVLEVFPDEIEANLEEVRKEIINN